MTGIESRATILGHVQRGGSPTLRDRVLATEMGYHAVELLEQGIGNRIVGLKDGKVYDIDIQEGLAMKKPFLDKRYDIFYETAY
jgi:6-phosphofructokinase 1